MFAGAFAAIGLSIVLVVLGSAFGFGAMSPFSGDGLSAATIGTVTILWLNLTQIFASVAGGYIAGRMRICWSIHNDEVYFRDTVHGFLTWAVATAVTAAAIESDEVAPSTPIVDHLYRFPGANPELLAAARLEAERLVVRATADEESVTAADRNWLEADVAKWTGLSAEDAEGRGDSAFAELNVAREAVGTARAATATLAIATALAMMVGAFVAAFAAVDGGRERGGLEDRLVSP